MTDSNKALEQFKPAPTLMSWDEVEKLLNGFLNPPERAALVNTFCTFTDAPYYVIEDAIENQPRYRIYAAAAGVPPAPSSMELMVAASLNLLALYPVTIDQLDRLKHDFGKCHQQPCMKAQLFLQNSPGFVPELTIDGHFSAHTKAERMAFLLISSLNLGAHKAD